MKITLITFLAMMMSAPLTNELNNEDAQKVKDIEAYVQYINKGTNDSDKLKETKDIFDANSFAFKEAKTETFSTLLRKNIVKVKVKEYLQNNFIKLKSYYFKGDQLICVKIDELLHARKGKVGSYDRAFYFENDRILLDTKKGDCNKYCPETLIAEAKDVLVQQYEKKKNS